MLMERTAEIIRGWPYDGALDRVEPITAGTTLVNGDWVVKAADNTVGFSATAAGNGQAGLVVVGNGDSASAAYTGKAVVLWSNFIAKLSNYTAGTYAPGNNLTVKSGKVTLAGASDPVIGTVLEVVAAGTTETAHLTVVVG